MNKFHITPTKFPARALGTAADVFAGTIINKDLYEIKGKLPSANYGGKYLVTMLPGSGNGPQLMEFIRDIFEAAYVPVNFEIIESDPKNHTEEDDRRGVMSIKRNRVGIKGELPLTVQSSNVSLRTHLDLFVNLVHCKGYANVKCRHPTLDLFVFRQNTEGEYSMLEHENKKGVVESLKIITRKNTERFARWAFEFAKREGRKKVTIVHKANIMKLSDGLFLKISQDIGKKYPDLKVDNMIVDNACMQMVSHPEQFDVLMMPNLYGNIISNLLCGLIGGPGLISGQNYGENCAVFEMAARHILTHDDPKYANPVAMVNAAINMLYHLQKTHHADLIRNAVRKTISKDKIHTPDLGGKYTGQDVVCSIIGNIKKGLAKSTFSLL